MARTRLLIIIINIITVTDIYAVSALKAQMCLIIPIKREYNLFNEHKRKV